MFPRSGITKSTCVRVPLFQSTPLFRTSPHGLVTVKPRRVVVLHRLLTRAFNFYRQHSRPHVVQDNQKQIEVGCIKSNKPQRKHEFHRGLKLYKALLRGIEINMSVIFVLSRMQRYYKKYYKILHTGLFNIKLTIWNALKESKSL